MMVQNLTVESKFRINFYICCTFVWISASLSQKSSLKQDLLAFFNATNNSLYFFPCSHPHIVLFPHSCYT